MKTTERARARIMRRERGESIKEIAAALGVSTSSVSYWVRDIVLTPEQLDVLRRRNPALNGQLVQHIYGAIQEYAGFDREEWLDCFPRAA